MKKKVIHFVQYALIKILFFGAVYPLHAQISNPSSWESFVGSDENRLVSDTFRLQTFGKSVWDNWSFILTYIIHSGFISGYQNRYGDNLKPPTNVYHRMTA